MTPFPRADYRLVERYAPDRRPVEVDLSDNTNLWGTHPAALARIRAATTDDLARYPELYADTLREAVSERFGVPPECVTTGAGSDDVLDSAFRAAAGTDETVTLASPTFSMIEPLARMNGMEPRAVPWPAALEDPERLLEGGPALVYVCRPNNPTGESAPRAWVEALLAARGDGGPLVVLDEAYADFSGESFLSEAQTVPRFLVARTASKSYGLAGLRCGFAVGSADVVLEVDKSRGPYKVARLAAEAAAAAIRDEDGWMAATVAEALANRERLADALAGRDLPPLPSAANFLLIPAPGDSAHHAALRLRELGVAVRPFTGVHGIGDGLRVSIGPWAMLERFLEALDTLVAETGPSTGVSP